MNDPFAALPHAGAYRVVYADPPWAFATWSHRGADRGAVQHYDTMSLDAIKALPVSTLAAPDAALFLWVVQPMLPEALDLIAAWGFAYKTFAFIWVKSDDRGPRLFFDQVHTFKGLGYHTRAGAELCLLATRGKGRGYERLCKGVGQVVIAPRREHSRKPDDIAEAIIRLAGGPRVELFARTQRAGFDAWGNQTDKFTEIPPAASPPAGSGAANAAVSGSLPVTLAAAEPAGPAAAALLTETP